MSFLAFLKKVAEEARSICLNVFFMVLSLNLIILYLGGV